MADCPTLKIKLQIMCAGEIAMGPGKADLLDAIARDGSISAAARRLGMSYRRAWLLVDTMNRCWSKPLVATMPGAGGGKGARLTPAGEEILERYRRLQAAADLAGDSTDWAHLSSAMLARPRSSVKA